MTALSANICLAGTLDDRTIGAMFALYDQYYDAASETRFRSDLRDKDHVIFLSDSSERLRGFSTLCLNEEEFEGCTIRTIFSGDTIIDQAYWGEQALSFAWIRLAGQIWAEAPETPLYWFLIVKGFRTYRYLPVFAKQFYPSFREKTPAKLRRLLEYVARQRFGDAYDSARGVISFPESRGHLKEAWAGVPESDRKRPEVRFFLDRNPGYVYGDELACITELTPANLRPLTRRVFSQGMGG